MLCGVGRVSHARALAPWGRWPLPLWDSAGHDTFLTLCVMSMSHVLGRFSQWDTALIGAVSFSAVFPSTSLVPLYAAGANTCLALCPTGLCISPRRLCGVQIVPKFSPLRWHTRMAGSGNRAQTAVEVLIRLSFLFAGLSILTALISLLVAVGSYHTGGDRRPVTFPVYPFIQRKIEPRDVEELSLAPRPSSRFSFEP